MITMTSRVRKFALTAHVASSVGWLGAVVGFLALAVAGLMSQDELMVRGTYLAMELTGWFVIVPFSLAALATGLVQSLGTDWGLFRHYWILAKLLITILATILLVLHMELASRLAGMAAETTLSGAEGLKIQLVADAGAAVLALLVATILAVYKPRGVTRYGWRKHHEQRATRAAGEARGADRPPYPGTPGWVKVFGIIAVVFVVLLKVFKAIHGGPHTLGHG
jgi:hypothetical protein